MGRNVSYTAKDREVDAKVRKGISSRNFVGFFAQLRAITKAVLFISICLLAISGNAQVLDSTATPWSLHGSVSLGSTWYKVSGIEDRQRPYGYFANINLTPTVRELSLPFNIIINQQQTRFTQPFTRFGISPEYKWAKLHLGHRNLYFSEFTLSGVTFFGAGIELEPGKFRTAAMYGRFRPATLETTNLYQVPQYERNGYSARIGFGNEEDYLDLIFFQAEDDPSSLSLSDSLERVTSVESNTAFGIQINKRYLKDKQLYTNIDAGLSIFTEDLNSIGTELLADEGAPEFLNANASTHANWAGKCRIGYKTKRSDFGIELRYVDDGYKSLGINYLLNDLAQVTGRIQTRMAQNKLILSASFGKMYNNLSERLSARTDRNIGSAQVNWMATEHFNLFLTYANFSVAQQAIRDNVYNDTLLIDQVNHTLNLTPVYRWNKESVSHSIQTTLTYQQLSDKNEVTAAYSENQVTSAQFSYQLQLKESGWGIQFGSNYNDFQTALINRKRYGVSAGFSKAFIENKLRLGLRSFYNIDEQPSGDEGSIMNNSLNLRYSPTKTHSILLNYNILDVNGLVPFTEQRAGLTYRMNFSAVKKKTTTS